MKFIFFLLPLLDLFRIDFIGSFTLSDFAVLLIGFLAAKNAGVKEIDGYRIYLKIVMLFLIYSGALLLSDLTNQVDWSDFMRGQATVIMLLLLTASYVKILPGKIECLNYYALGKVFVGIYAIFFGLSMDDVPWDERGDKYYMFKYGGLLVGLAWYAMIIMRDKSPMTISYIFFFLGILLVSINGRSDGLIFCFVGILVLVRNSRYWVRQNRNIFGKLILLGGLLYVFYIGYVYIAYEKAVFGRDNRSYIQLAECKNPYDPIDYLMQGRLEMYIAYMAIQEKPWIGYGSWGRDNTQKFVREQILIKKPEITPDGLALQLSNRGNYIPAHSILMGAWLWAGVVGMLAWVVIYISVIKWAWSLLMVDGPFKTMLIFIIVRFSWDFFCSPLTGVRFYLPFYIGALLLVGYSYQLCRQPDADGNVLS